MSVRVARTSGALYGEPSRSRKRRRCAGHLSAEHWIEVGQEFIWSALPPDHPEVGNRGWWHDPLCMDCAPAEVVGEQTPDVCRICDRPRYDHDGMIIPASVMTAHAEAALVGVETFERISTPTHGDPEATVAGPPRFQP